ncbi:MAG: NADH-ubiquinone oxidoreductase-F iron-sulfur binding region domain-containing protein, partial [Planctomycetota bacterium]
TGYADRVFKRIVAGEGRLSDLDLFYELASNFEWTTICPLATAAAWPIKSFVSKFRDHFDKYLEQSTRKDAERELTAQRPGAFM